MKKLLALALLFTACTQTAAVHQRDFNFKFTYGISDAPTQNVLNTFNDTFTKDMVVDAPITVTMVLSDEEMKTIQDKIAELDLFGEFQGATTDFVTPCEDYKLEVDYGSTGGGGTEWDCKSNVGDRATFVDFMMDFIQAKAEFKALPEPKGAYM